MAKNLSKVAQAAVAIAVIMLPLALIVSAANQQNYDIEARNQTGAKIQDLSVRMSGKRYSFGVLDIGATATIAFQQGRPTSSAEVNWTGGDGHSHRVEVDLTALPRRYDGGIITFTLLAVDDVKVGFSTQPDTFFITRAEHVEACRLRPKRRFTLGFFPEIR